jgi:hypothetical protein
MKNGVRITNGNIISVKRNGSAWEFEGEKKTYLKIKIEIDQNSARFISMKNMIVGISAAERLLSSLYLSRETDLYETVDKG